MGKKAGKKIKKSHTLLSTPHFSPIYNYCCLFNFIFFGLGWGKGGHMVELGERSFLLLLPLLLLSLASANDDAKGGWVSFYPLSLSPLSPSPL